MAGVLQQYNLGRVDYLPVWQAMQRFTDSRDADTPDELWLVEHLPVFTQGQAGKAEHLLAPGDIPVVATDRGGQVTYHGPGQLVAYPLLNIKRLKMGVRQLVSLIEESVVALLQEYDIDAAPRPDAPGVYVDGNKIASLGLRVRRGCSFHGVAINIDAELEPFDRINPCGYQGLKMTRLKDLTNKPVSVNSISQQYADILANKLGLILQPGDKLFDFGHKPKTCEM